jgi:hypothetical protein
VGTRDVRDTLDSYDADGRVTAVRNYDGQPPPTTR